MASIDKPNLEYRYEGKFYIAPKSQKEISRNWREMLLALMSWVCKPKNTP